MVLRAQKPHLRVLPRTTACSLRAHPKKPQRAFTFVAGYLHGYTMEYNQTEIDMAVQLRHRTRGLALFLALALLLPLAIGCGGASETQILAKHVQYLADDAREGRGIGTEGLDQAAEYIANQMVSSGLQPLFGDDGYFQPFDMSWGIELLEGCDLSVGDQVLSLGSDYQPLGFSSSSSVTAQAVFAGYGISAQEYGYDDYAELDVKGKIVVVLTGEPAADSDSSMFAGRAMTDHSALRTKAILAKTLGAAGIIVLERRWENEEDDTLPALRKNEPYRDSGLPIVQVTRDAAKTLFPRTNFDLIQRSIDANEAPRSMPLGDTELHLAVALERSSVPVRNVGGMIPGDDRVLVLGAHYDHLGYGQTGSNDPEPNVIHNGADDNASGTSMLLEVARYFAQNPPGPTVWVVAFTGEEVGLVGSHHFVSNPPDSLNRVFAMLNFDMIGRMQGNSLTVFGAKSAEELTTLAERAAEGQDIQINPTGGGFGASDQTSFFTSGIPVLHLMTALHADYHTSRDDADKINRAGMKRVYDYALALVRELSDPDLSLTYVAQEPPRSDGGGRAGIKVSFGIIPDFAQPDSLHGLRLQGVRPGTPPQRAASMRWMWW